MTRRRRRRRRPELSGGPAPHQTRQLLSHLGKLHAPQVARIFPDGRHE